MLLRKHLTGARIVSISQPEHERMLELEIDTHDELGFAARKKLVLELIGRTRTSYLSAPTGASSTVCAVWILPETRSAKMMPGMFYRMPPKQNKLSVFDAAEDERRALIAQADRAAPMDKWLLGIFGAVAAAVPRACISLGGDYERLDSCISALLESIANGETAPYILTRDGAPFDYSCIAIGQYGNAAETERFDSFRSCWTISTPDVTDLSASAAAAAEHALRQDSARPHSEKACRAERGAEPCGQPRRAEKAGGAGHGEHIPHEKGDGEPRPRGLIRARLP